MGLSRHSDRERKVPGGAPMKRSTFLSMFLVPLAAPLVKLVSPAKPALPTTIYLKKKVLKTKWYTDLDLHRGIHEDLFRKYIMPGLKAEIERESALWNRLTLPEQKLPGRVARVRLPSPK